MAREGAAVLGVVLVVILACWIPPVASTPSIEINALKAIRSSLIDPLNNLKDWVKSDPCRSNWTGVICHNFTDDLHVTELRLLRKNLTGTIAPEVGLLTYVTVLDFLWNSIGGSIPKEVGNMTSLQILLLSGNNISGPLPDELGNLPNITKFQLDLNYISGPLPASFANLKNIKHFHMNNNSISGQIPPGLHQLPALIHMLLDNNNLSGYLPPELAQAPKLRILQLDNNNFGGSQIPSTYGNMSTLRKLSLRNCNLTGPVPDFSTAPLLLYLDLSLNNLTGGIPANRVNSGVTTINMSFNQLNGSIPPSFSGLPSLQALSLQSNFLTGDIPVIWQNISFLSNSTLKIELQNNALTDINGTLNPPPNVTLLLQGNPVCRKQNIQNIAAYCEAISEVPAPPPPAPVYPDVTCLSQSCPGGYQYVSGAPRPCYCAAPLGVVMRLRSPSISYFPPYQDMFVSYISSNLNLDSYQVAVVPNYIWERGPRLRMIVDFFPQYGDNSGGGGKFNPAEARRIVDGIATFVLPTNDTFGPYDLINFIPGLYADDINLPTPSKGWSKGVTAAVVLGSFACVGVMVLAVVLILYVRRTRRQEQPSRRESLPKVPMKVEGIKGFSFADLEKATNRFDVTVQIGQGGYGKVYKGVLGDGTVVAIKRAEQGSIQGQKEFFTEIEMLSRVHHRNLVSLIGYCDEENEQMLVYEFMPNGSLHSRLSARYSRPLSYAGYLDPEYLMTHKLTEKSDVYSLGVVLLELLTGMPPISHGRNLVREVQQACQSGMMPSFIDRNMGTHPSDSIKKFMELALRCCEDQKISRPSMLEVVRELENLSSALSETDPSASESDSSNPRVTPANPSPLYSRSFIETREFAGSDLIEGHFLIRPYLADRDQQVGGHAINRPGYAVDFIAVGLRGLSFPRLFLSGFLCATTS
ncbi:hypothetical protein MLD38_038350 [Melastoma candidum]|uniref:Uncharacterized protein n=1 Tax=Melastoma candidum TaxID=119954 RepID=A0ACB9KZ82_9MYRT|nr:hypothetical protein MLD38_038350 [Melastoma candidum]